MGNWYIVETNPNCEEKASRELRRSGFRAYIPKRYFVHQNKRSGEKKVKARSLMAGYILMRFPDDRMRNGVPHFGTARKCQGVKNFVRFANEAGEWEPCPLPEKHVASLMRRQRWREFGRPAQEDSSKRYQRLSKTYRKGRKMPVTEGPFAGFLAKIDRLRKDGKVEVEIEVLGRMTKLLISDPDSALRSAA